MTDYSYLLLGSEDLGRFKELNRLFGDVFEDAESYHSAVPSDEYLESFLNKEHCVVLVAMKEDEVVGGLVAYVLDKFEKERREIYIYDLVVLTNHRRKGIATGLINKLKDVARELGAYVIFVQADKGDEPAIKLYESLGTKEETLNFDIKTS